jgi:hypothetical protein
MTLRIPEETVVSVPQMADLYTPVCSNGATRVHVCAKMEPPSNVNGESARIAGEICELEHGRVLRKDTNSVTESFVVLCYGPAWAHMTIVLLMMLLVVLLVVLAVTLELAERLSIVVRLIVTTLELAELVGLQVAEEETSTVLVAMLDLVVERVLVNDEYTIVELCSAIGLCRRDYTRRSSEDGGKVGSASLSDVDADRGCVMGRGEGLHCSILLDGQ